MELIGISSAVLYKWILQWNFEEITWLMQLFLNTQFSVQILLHKLMIL